MATTIWKLDALLDHLVQEVRQTQDSPTTVIDRLAPIKLDPADEWGVIRAGLQYLMNGNLSTGLRGWRKHGTARSGRAQTAKGRVRPVKGQMAARVMFFLESQMIYEGADGKERGVVDFTAADTQHQYDLRVQSPRDRANREEPFWARLQKETVSGRTLRRASQRLRKQMMDLAVQCGLP